MAWIDVMWTEENEKHVADAGFAIDEIEYVLRTPIDAGTSRSSGRPFVIGYTPDARRIMVVYEHVDRITVYPITAFLVED